MDVDILCNEAWGDKGRDWCRFALVVELSRVR